MKKWIDHIAKRVFTVSGFVTSAIILLIIGFLFTEAVGLFNNPIVEDGYTLVVNKGNIPKMGDGVAVGYHSVPSKTSFAGISLSSSMRMSDSFWIKFWGTNAIIP